MQMSFAKCTETTLCHDRDWHFNLLLITVLMVLVVFCFKQAVSISSEKHLEYWLVRPEYMFPCVMVHSRCLWAQRSRRHPLDNVNVRFHFSTVRFKVCVVACDKSKPEAPNSNCQSPVFDSDWLHKNYCFDHSEWECTVSLLDILSFWLTWLWGEISFSAASPCLIIISIVLLFLTLLTLICLQTVGFESSFFCSCSILDSVVPVWCKDNWHKIICFKTSSTHSLKLHMCRRIRSNVE